LSPTRLLLVLVGALIFLAGVVFILQGEGVVGPQSSFMYNNPTWVYQGAAAAVVGFLIVLAGLLLRRKPVSVSPA
jgi:hypothetical protein